MESSQYLELEETTPKISYQSLASINTPQIINTEGYTKNKKVIVLIDLGSTHNFIYYKLENILNFFACLAL